MNEKTWFVILMSSYVMFAIVLCVDFYMANHMKDETLTTLKYMKNTFDGMERFELYGVDLNVTSSPH